MGQQRAGVPENALLSPDGSQWWDAGSNAWRTIPVPARAVISPDRSQWWDGQSWRPIRRRPPASPPGTAISARPNGPIRRTGAGVAAAGAVAVIVGAFLPWASAGTFFGSLGRSAVEGGDGWFFIGVAVAIVLVSIRAAFTPVAMRRDGIALLLLSLLEGGLLGFEINDLNSKLAAANNSYQGFNATVSTGLYVTLLGTALALLGAFYHLSVVPSRRSQRGAKGAAAPRAKDAAPPASSWDRRIAIVGWIIAITAVLGVGIAMLNTAH